MIVMTDVNKNSNDNCLNVNSNAKIEEDLAECKKYLYNIHSSIDKIISIIGEKKNDKTQPNEIDYQCIDSIDKDRQVKKNDSKVENDVVVKNDSIDKNSEVEKSDSKDKNGAVGKNDNKDKDDDVKFFEEVRTDENKKDKTAFNLILILLGFLTLLMASSIVMYFLDKPELGALESSVTFAQGAITTIVGFLFGAKLNNK